MPYIKQEDREEFNGYLYEIGQMLDHPGELNYCFTVLIKHYLKKHDKSYQTINDCIGALECSKLEFYRRVVSGYEDFKKELNGDVKI